MAPKLEWVRRLDDRLPDYLEKLRVAGLPGHFYPCAKGTTAVGKNCSLGFSCLALKVYYTIGLWEKLPLEDRRKWMAFLKSFQLKGLYRGDPVTNNAFFDEAVMRYLQRREPWYHRLAGRLLPKDKLTYRQKVIMAETKQSIASLSQVREQPERPYLGFPTNPNTVRNHLLGLDWTKPWASGGQAAALAVFIKTQAPRFLERQTVKALSEACCDFFRNLVDEETGAYFQGEMPAHAEIVNGAMKVLTALDWLGEPVHYPRRLARTCLAQLPSPEGCHLVDAVYVLYQCSLQDNSVKGTAEKFCSDILDMIMAHQNTDGGFSYRIGQSQTHYYGVPITRGERESDIHGTCLLAWAVAMILKLHDSPQPGWRVIRP